MMLEPRQTGSPYGLQLDSSTNTYLNPPLIGLSYSDMVQNGMGNRRANDHQYHRLIFVHGLFAAIAILLLMPAALVCARFFLHGPQPRMAMWGHIGFQIGAIICLTITFVCGYFAVGKGEWGKNPHHIIGTTIYAAILVQALFGIFVRWRVMKKVRKRIGLHQMVHHWLGRGIFLLGVAQIPLGLYLYGSPLVLFILYAVLVFLFLCAWFLCEYLRVRGWFTHGFVRAPREETREEMSTIEPRNRESDLEGAAMGGVLAAEETPATTPKRGRFSNAFSFLVNRRQSRSAPPGDSYLTDGATSMDTSRAPSNSHSPAIGGLHAPPTRQTNIPPVPAIPPQHDEINGVGRYGSSGSISRSDVHRDPSDQYWKEKMHQNPLLRDTALRDSTTLGGPGGRLEMPEPVIPQSPQSPPQHQHPGYPMYPERTMPMPGVYRSPRQSQQSFHTPPGDEPPISPVTGGGYVEDDTGFVPSPVEQPPVIPLPTIPNHRREKSADNARLPMSHSSERVPLEGTPTPEGVRGSNPNVAVQVRLNPDGKSVTVRRLAPEEAERERRERARARADRATAREMELDREQKARRSGSIHRGGRPSIDETSRSNTGDTRETHTPGWTPPPPRGVPDDGDNTSSIAGASGGLLGSWRGSPPEVHSPTGLSGASPLIGLQPLGGGGVSRGGSVVSGTMSAENSEMEQEIIKEQRRRKRREERSAAANTSSGGSRGGTGGGNEDVEWT